MLSECWWRKKSSLWRLRLTNRKRDREKPQARTVPGVVVCTYLRLSECFSVSVHVCMWYCVLMWMSVCVVPLAGNRGRMEVLLIIRPPTWDQLSTYGNYTHTHIHTDADAILNTWAKCWGLAPWQRGNFQRLCVGFLHLEFLFLSLSLFPKRSTEVRKAAKCVWQEIKLRRKGWRRSREQWEGAKMRWLKTS